MSSSIAFYLDFGPEIGLGHLVRCSALAQAAQNRGFETILITRTLDALPAFCGEAFNTVTRLPADFDKQTLDSIAVLIVDHYSPSGEFLDQFRLKNIFAIKDYDSQNVSFAQRCISTIPRLDYPYPSFDLDLIHGPAYLLLRPAFAAARIETLFQSSFGQSKEIKSVFVALGGGQSSQLAAQLIRPLNERGIHLDLVLSKASGGLKECQEAASASAGHCNVHSDLDDKAISALMMKSDLALCNGGGSAWEAVAMGLPCILVKMAENQSNNIDHLTSSGSSVLAGSDEDEDITLKIVDQLDRLIASPDDYHKMVNATANLCDGLGCNRIWNWAFPASAKNNKRVFLRPANMEDADSTFDWQCQPETRAFARNKSIPERVGHDSWLREKLMDPNCIFSIIQLEGSPVGVVRLDVVDTPEELQHKISIGSLPSKAFEISIHLSKTYFGQGIAGAALTLARRLVPDTPILAFVHEENEASLHLFREAGYEQFGRWFVAPLHQKLSVK